MQRTPASPRVITPRPAPKRGLSSVGRKPSTVATPSSVKAPRKPTSARSCSPTRRAALAHLLADVVRRVPERGAPDVAQVVAASQRHQLDGPQRRRRRRAARCRGPTSAMPSRNGITRTASQCGAERRGRRRPPRRRRSTQRVSAAPPWKPSRASAAHTVPAPASNDRHAPRRRRRAGRPPTAPGDAGPVEQGVDGRLVLQRHPLWAAMGDERPPDERRRLVEELPNATARAVGVERLDGGDDVRRRVGERRATPAQTVAIMSRRRSSASTTTVVASGCGSGARAVRGHDEHVGGTRARAASPTIGVQTAAGPPATITRRSPTRSPSGSCHQSIRRPYRRPPAVLRRVCRAERDRGASETERGSRGQDHHAQLGHLADRVGGPSRVLPLSRTPP